MISTWHSRLRKKRISFRECGSDIYFLWKKNMRKLTSRGKLNWTGSSEYQSTRKKNERRPMHFSLLYASTHFLPPHSAEHNAEVKASEIKLRWKNDDSQDAIFALFQRKNIMSWLAPLISLFIIMPFSIKKVVQVCTKNIYARTYTNTKYYISCVLLSSAILRTQKMAFPEIIMACNFTTKSTTHDDVDGIENDKAMKLFSAEKKTEDEDLVSYFSHWLSTLSFFSCRK